MRRFFHRRRPKKASASAGEDSRTNEQLSGPIEGAAALVFSDGVDVLHDCPDATIDICFVHGLTGDRTSTWTAHGQTTPWPKSLLPAKLARARILTYGYDAYVVRKSMVSSNRMTDHATNLLVDLTNERAQSNASSRPLIFVAHSLGGLVCKEAILLSRNNPDHHRHDIFTNLKGIVFMGTPHTGSWMADWARIPASALGLLKSSNTSLLRILQTGDELLESLQSRFLALVREQREKGRQLEVTCFFEELPLPVVGKVVSKDSATFQGYDPITIHANHSDMVKFRSANENGFKRLLGELTTWKRDCDQSMLALAAATAQAHANTSTAFGNDVAAVTNDEATPAERTMHYLPLRKSRTSVERVAVIEHLKQLLFADPSNGQRAALVGLGGMGKTQTALQLAHQVKSNSQQHDNCSVIWIPALSMASFEHACTEIVNLFGIQDAGGEEKDPKEAVRKFLLSDKTKKWLLIVDNADDMSALYEPDDDASDEEASFRPTQRRKRIADFLPDSGNVRILFTTRSQQVAVRVANPNVVKLQEMYSNEAKALLRKSLIDNNQTHNEALVDGLLEKLTCLPLAISQASSYMNENSVPIKEYLELLQNTNQDMEELLNHGFHDNSLYQRSQGAVATTWIVSFNQIRDTDEAAADLMSFTAYIEPKAIPRSMLPSVGSAQQMTRAIGTLCGYGFLSRRDDNDTFDMHSLVHLAMQLWNKKHSLETEQRQAAAVHLSSIFPLTDWEHRDLWRQYLPHALKVFNGEHGCESQEFGDLGGCIGRCLYVEMRMTECVETFEKAVAIRKTLRESDPKRLASEHQLAYTYLENDQVEKAIKLLEGVIAIRRETFGDNDTERLAYQHELARAYLRTDKVEEAIKLLEGVVAIEGGTLRKNHPDRLASEHVLASAYLQNDKVEKAIKLFEGVVAIRRETLREDHPYRLTAEHELAKAYFENNQVEKAIKLFEGVVAIRRETLREDHSNRLASEHELAHAYLENGQVKEAVDLLEHVVAIEAKSLPETSPSRIVSKELLQTCYETLASSTSSPT